MSALWQLPQGRKGLLPPSHCLNYSRLLIAAGMTLGPGPPLALSHASSPLLFSLDGVKGRTHSVPLQGSPLDQCPCCGFLEASFAAVTASWVGAEPGRARSQSEPPLQGQVTLGKGLTVPEPVCYSDGDTRRGTVRMKGENIPSPRQTAETCVCWAAGAPLGCFPWASLHWWHHPSFRWQGLRGLSGETWPR